MSTPECTVSLTYTARYGARAGVSFVPTILLATAAIWSIRTSSTTTTVTDTQWKKWLGMICWDKVFMVCFPELFITEMITKNIWSYCWRGKSSADVEECADNTSTTTTVTPTAAVVRSKQRLLVMAWTFYEATLIPVLLIAFEAVDCNWTSDQPDVVLDASPRIRCRNNLKWTRFPIVFSSLFIMVSVITTHVLYAYALRCVQKGTASSVVEAAFKPITEQFKEKHWWWVFVPLLKKASFSIAALVLSERPEWLVGGVGMLLLSIFVLSFILNPYLEQSDLHNEWKDNASEVVQIILAGIALGKSDDDEEISLVISVVFYFVMVVDIVRIGYEVRGRVKEASLARTQRSAQSTTSISTTPRWAEARTKNETQVIDTCYR
eukprot:8148076-Pyramimonas_sp.AAC.1